MKSIGLRAGGTHPPFSPNAIAEIGNISRGIPRLINSVCENALTWAVAEKSELVEPRHVHNAAADLRLNPPPVPVNIRAASALKLRGHPDEAADEPAHESVSAWNRWKEKFSFKRTPQITSLLGPLDHNANLVPSSKKTFSLK